MNSVHSQQPCPVCGRATAQRHLGMRASSYVTECRCCSRVFVRTFSGRFRTPTRVRPRPAP